MTVSKARRKLVIAVLPLALGILATLPARADTESDLAEARKRAAQIEKELNRATAEYQAAYGRLQETAAAIAETEARIEKTKAKLNRLQASLGERARTAYQRGVAGTIELLLSSSSVSEFSDRVEFLDRMSQDDADLIIQTEVTREQLRRDEAALKTLRERQAATLKTLDQKQSAIRSKFQESEALVSKLARQLKAERAAAAAALRRAAPSLSGAPAPVVSGGALQACPVAGPRSYYNDYGAPRSGGRTHQGNDILAPYGTPVVAAQPGRFEGSSNDLGGISAYIYGSNGDLTYYAHLAGYAGVASGSTVSAGTQIGTVGTSGNAAGGPPHLHFEYHPGGGGPTNPYPYLQAVCG